jgi:hypothetical protein
MLGGEKIPAIGSECNGLTSIGYRKSAQALSPFCAHESRLAKVSKSQSDYGPSIIQRDRWCKIYNFRSL